MSDVDIKPILEGILFTSESPVRMETLSEILPEWSPEAVSDGIERIKKEWEDGLKGLELVEVAGGYQFRTKPQWAEYIHRLKKKKPVKLSQSALETLAIIAYRQPVIRPEIEEIRGVDSGWVVRTLLEKGLIRMMGRKDLPGRPIVYGTTKAFLELFSLSSLTDLPTLKEILPPPNPEEASQEDLSKMEKGGVSADEPLHTEEGEGNLSVPQPEGEVPPSTHAQVEAQAEELEVHPEPGSSTPPAEAGLPAAERVKE